MSEASHRARRRCPTCQQERERGAVLAITALLLTTLIAMSAMTIDLGRLMIKRRDLQALADVVSLDLARELTGGTKASYDAANPLSAISQHRDQSVQRNGGNPTTVTFELGTVLNGAKGQQFQSIADTATPNAIKVTASDSVDYFFAQVIGQSSGTTTRSSVATRQPTARWQVGSFLAAASPTIPQLELLNRVLARWLGIGGLNPDLGLDVLSYQGLANTTVTLSDISTRMGFASPDQLMAGTVNAGQFFNAAADVAQANGASAATVSATRRFATSVSGTQQLSLSSVVSPAGAASASSGNGSGAEGALSLLGILQGSAAAINGANTITVPGLSVAIPNLGTVDLTLKVIQKPNVCEGPVGTPCPTSQVEMGIVTHLDLDVAASLPGLPSPRLRGTVSVAPSVAGANASPTAIRCYSGGDGMTIALDANPISATGSESLILSASTGLLGASVDLLSTTVSNAAVSTTSAAGAADFVYRAEFLPPIGTGGTKRIGSATLNLSGALSATSANTTVLSLALPLGTMLAGVNSALTTSVFPAIQDQLLPFITSTLGLSLGGGDVGARDRFCNSPKLVG